MTARFITLHMTAGEAETARRVRGAREAMVRGQGGDALVAALRDPCISILLAEIADTWDVTTDPDEGREV